MFCNSVKLKLDFDKKGNVLKEGSREGKEGPRKGREGSRDRREGKNQVLRKA